MIRWLTFGRKGVALRESKLVSAKRKRTSSQRVVSGGALLFLLVAPTAAQNPLEWVATFGGSGPLAEHLVADVALAPGGDYFAVGVTSSFGQGGRDGWIARVSRQGDVLWEFAIGTTSLDEFSSVDATPDGGCIVVGTTGSFVTDEGAGWVVKLDSMGVIEWQRVFDIEHSNEMFVSVDVNSTGFFPTYYVGGILEHLSGFEDVWVLKLDSSGAPIWQKRLGGNFRDWVAAVSTTSDGGVVFVANSNSSFSPSDNVPFHRPWIVRLDAGGVSTAQRTFNWSGGDLLNDVAQTADGGFILTGEIGAMRFFRGDLWAQRLDGNLDVVWNQRYGNTPETSEVWDSGERVQITPAGEFLIVGSTVVPPSQGPNNPFIWLLHLDSAGELIADRTFGGSGYDIGKALALGATGEVAVGGRTQLTVGGLGTAFLAHVPDDWATGTPDCPPPTTTSPLLDWGIPLTAGAPTVEPAAVTVQPRVGESIPISLATRSFLCE